MMRIARAVAFTFTAVCLVVAAGWLLAPVEQSFSAGAASRSYRCGSAAFPKQLIDFGENRVGDAANCAGGAPASVALYAVVLAGLGLAASVVICWWSSRPRVVEAVS
jgi:hypothetical protein